MNWKKKNLKENQYIGDMLMQQFMVTYDGNNHNVRNKNKHMRNQLKLLSNMKQKLL